MHIHTPCVRPWFSETILKLIPLEKDDVYVDMASSPAVPFFSSQVIEPLGECLGQSNVCAPAPRARAKRAAALPTAIYPRQLSRSLARTPPATRP